MVCTPTKCRERDVLGTSCLSRSKKAQTKVVRALPGGGSTLKGGVPEFSFSEAFGETVNPCG
jgi:hypothetical protein